MSKQIKIKFPLRAAGILIIFLLLVPTIISFAEPRHEPPVPDEVALQIYEDIPNELWHFTTLDGNTVEIRNNDGIPEFTLYKWGEEVSLSGATVPVGAEVGEYELEIEENTIKWKLKLTDGFEYEIEFEPSNIGENGGFEWNTIIFDNSTNVFTIPIQSEGLDFYYQPPLNESEVPPPGGGVNATHVWDEEGNITTYRPIDVVGSYAVYHSSKMNNEYKAGKAFHIYYPYLIDAEGWKVRAEDFEIDTEKGLLTITLPQEFLDKAIYPVTVDPNFGYESIGGSDLSIYYYPYACKFQITENGQAQSISWYLLAKDIAPLNVGIYDSGENRLELGSGSASYAAGWKLINLNSNPSLTANAYYWLWGRLVLTISRFGRYDAGETNQGAYDDHSVETAPDPMGPTAYNDRKISVYCTYEVEAPTTVTQTFLSTTTTDATVCIYTVIQVIIDPITTVTVTSETYTTHETTTTCDTTVVSSTSSTTTCDTSVDSSTSSTTTCDTSVDSSTSSTTTCTSITDTTCTSTYTETTETETVTTTDTTEHETTTTTDTTVSECITTTITTESECITTTITTESQCTTTTETTDTECTTTIETTDTECTTTTETTVTSYSTCTTTCDTSIISSTSTSCITTTITHTTDCETICETITSTTETTAITTSTVVRTVVYDACVLDEFDDDSLVAWYNNTHRHDSIVDIVHVPALDTPDVILNVTGVLDDGNITSVQIFDDGDTYNVSEVTGAPGFDIQFNFTGLTGDYTNVNCSFYLWYDGGAGDTVLMQTWNYTASAWITCGTITEAAGFGWFNFSRLGAGPDIVSDGVIIGRIYHSSPGKIAHDIYIDYIELNMDVCPCGQVWSTNMLEDLNVTQIVRFRYNITIPTAGGAFGKVQFSQDNSTWVGSGGIEAWEAMSDGDNTILLTGLDWAGNFYYRIWIQKDINGTSPTLDLVQVCYSTIPPGGGGNILMIPALVLICVVVVAMAGMKKRW